MPTQSPPKGTKWTILDALKWTTSYFESHGIESPRASAEILLAHNLEVQRIDLYLRHDQPLSGDELADYKALIKRRIQNEPVAYITGIKEFWSMELAVTPDVLIPRPETECLVERAGSLIESTGTVPLRILELGTGSGAVILALASQYERHVYLATDISYAALRVAAENADKFGLKRRIGFLAADWLEAFRKDRGVFDVVISNPPYIAEETLAELPPDIRGHEPRLALNGGKDGLDCLREIIRNAHWILDHGGTVFLEIGHDQGDAATTLASETGRYRQISVYKDYGGNDRVLRFRRC